MITLECGLALRCWKITFNGTKINNIVGLESFTRKVRSDARTANMRDVNGTQTIELYLNSAVEFQT